MQKKRWNKELFRVRGAALVQFVYRRQIAGEEITVLEKIVGR